MLIGFEAIMEYILLENIVPKIVINGGKESASAETIQNTCDNTI